MRPRTLLLGVMSTLVAVPVALALWPDQTLEPRVMRTLEMPQRLPAQRNLFNHVVGLAVAAEEDPARAAHEAVTRVNELLAGSSGEVESQRLGAAWVAEVLALSDPGQVLCSTKDADCVSRLLAAREEIGALADAHPVLMGRYRTLSAASGHRMELLPHVSMPLPGFRTLLDVHRLVLAVWLAGHLEGDPGAQPRLLDDVRFLRRFLAQADYLLGKMVAAAMLADDLYAYAAMMDASPGVMQAFPVLEPLSEQERSMQAALESEFRFNAQAVMSVAQDPEMRGSDVWPAWLQAAALRSLYKPRRSINQTFYCFANEAAAARLDAAKFALLSQGDRDPRCRVSWLEWIMNPVGSILLEVARPDLSRYTARLHDLNGLITLVNLKRAVREARVEEADMQAFLARGEFLDPYTGKPMRWDGETRSVYFESPRPGSGYERLVLDPLAGSRGRRGG